MIYSGQSKEAGHAFVCDGYDGYGLFHINWGWDGMSDGYFRLQALNPYAQGTGGSKSGYAYYQSALIGISPGVVEDGCPIIQRVRVDDFKLAESDEVSLEYSGNAFSDVAVYYSYTVSETAKYDLGIALYQGDERTVQQCALL